jgi:hypothetical protein
MNGFLIGTSSMVMVGTIAFSLLMRRIALLERGLWLLKRNCSCYSLCLSLHFLVLQTKSIMSSSDLLLFSISIHNLGIIGHVEDVSIAKDHQGKHSGQEILKTLNTIAANAICFKKILNFSPRNQDFYGKCDYETGDVASF